VPVGELDHNVHFRARSCRIFSVVSPRRVPLSASNFGPYFGFITTNVVLYATSEYEAVVIFRIFNLRFGFSYAE